MQHGATGQSVTYQGIYDAMENYELTLWAMAGLLEVDINRGRRWWFLKEEVPRPYALIIDLMACRGVHRGELLMDIRLWQQRQEQPFDPYCAE